MATASAGPARPVIPGMRLMLLVVSVLVFLAGIQLFALAEDTGRYFAWTIRPPLTAACLGAAYLASCMMELLASRQTSWHRARIAGRSCSGSVWPCSRPQPRR